MTKTNYRELLEFVAKNMEASLDVEMEPYGLATAMIEGCRLLNEDGKHVGVVGYGDIEEEACADYVRMLHGKTLVFPYKDNGKKYFFDEEFEKYRLYKKEEANTYIPYDEYLLFLDKEELFTRKIIEVSEIETKTIKGHELYIIDSNEKYFSYIDICPELQNLKAGNVLRAWYYTDLVCNYGNILVKFEIIK